VRRPGDWAQLDLSGDPILIVGRRSGRQGLEGFVVDLHEETFETMRAIANETIAQLGDREGLEWSPNAAIERGEQYLAIDVGDLPAPPEHADQPTAEIAGIEAQEPAEPPPYVQLAQAAELLGVVLVPGQLENLNAAGLEGGNFRFYALAWESGDAGKPVAFVSEYDPTSVLRKASSWFRYDGTLRSAAPPDFSLNSKADLLVTTSEIAILSPAAFDRLFADIRALLNDVPANVLSLAEALTNLQVSDASRHAFEEICATKPSFARRLQNLVARGGLNSITATTFRRVLRNHGLTASEFLRGGTIDVDPEQVGTVLDVLEGRWYEADFSDEPRRAGSWSRRKEPSA
jgi:hypothetical protein